MTSRDGSLPDAGFDNFDRPIKFVGDSRAIAMAPGSQQYATFELAKDYSSVFFRLEGDSYSDSSLNVSAQVPENHRVSVLITASSVEAKFTLVASANGDEERVHVTVESSNRFKVTAKTIYNGERKPDNAVPTMGKAYEDKTCAELGLIDDTSVGETQANESGVLEFDNLPIRRPHAITARLGAYAVGCKDVVSAVSDDNVDIVIELRDTWMNLSKFDFDINLIYVPLGANNLDTFWNYLWHEKASRYVDPIFPADHPGGRVIELMHELLPEEHRASFATRRVEDRWDEQADRYFEDKAIDVRKPLVLAIDRATRRLRKALARQPLRFKVKIVAVPGFKSLVESRPESLNGIPATEAGFTMDDQQTSLTVETVENDTIEISQYLYVRTAALIAREIKLDNRVGSVEHGWKDIVQGWKDTVQCRDLVGSLANVPSGPGTCDSACMAKMCEDALAHAWNLFVESTVNEVAIEVFSKSKIKVNEFARPVSWYGGDWDGVVNVRKGRAYRASVGYAVHGKVEQHIDTPE